MLCFLQGEAKEGGEGGGGKGCGEEGDGQGAQVVGGLLLAAAGREGRQGRQEGGQGQEEKGCWREAERSQFQVMIIFLFFVGIK